MHVLPHRSLLARLTSLFFLALILLTPATASAQMPPIFPDCDPLPGPKSLNGSSAEDCVLGDLIQLAINIYNLLLYFASFVALLMIVWAGVRMLWFSYFENSEAELANAKLTLTRAIVGLVIIIAAYLIVNTLVNFLTGQDINSLLP